MANLLDTAEITSGPGYLEVDGDRLSHTQGGITVNITPSTRNRTVDVYGESPIQVIHQGDDVRVTAPLAQWTAEVLKNVYDPGDDQTEGGSGGSFLGLGRSAGYFYTPRAVDVIPVASNLSDLKVSLWKACPVGQVEMAHAFDTDRVLNTEFVALVDETKDDGQLMGAMYVEDPSSE